VIAGEPTQEPACMSMCVCVHACVHAWECVCMCVARGKHTLACICLQRVACVVFAYTHTCSHAYTCGDNVIAYVDTVHTHTYIFLRFFVSRECMHRAVCMHVCTIHGEEAQRTQQHWANYGVGSWQVRAHTYMHMYVCMCVSVFIYIYIYIYIYS
jgi:hypothetical protein